MKIMIATGRNVSLAWWFIDDTLSKVMIFTQMSICTSVFSYFRKIN